VPRPSTLTPDLARAIQASTAANPNRLTDELRKAGFAVSGRTVRRHLATLGKTTASPPRWPGYADARPLPAHMRPPAPEPELSGPIDPIAELERDARKLRALREFWLSQGELGPAAARTFATINRQYREALRELAQIIPPAPPDPENDPANVDAKRRLLAMVDEALARCP
jgi:hypothetical protein